MFSFFPKISYEQLDRFSVSTKQSSSRGSGVTPNRLPEIGSFWVLTTMKIISVIKRVASFVCAYCQLDFCVGLIFDSFLKNVIFREGESEKNLPPKIELL